MVIGDAHLPVAAKWLTSCFHICNTFMRRDEVLEQRIELICRVRGVSDPSASLAVAGEMCRRPILQMRERLAQKAGKLARFGKALEQSHDVSSLLRALDVGGALTNLINFDFVGKKGCSTSGLAGGKNDARRLNTSSV